MRFKALPKLNQSAIAHSYAEYVGNQPADLAYPVVPPTTWLAALRHLNVRIRANGMPSADDLVRVVDHVEENLYGLAPAHGICDCCGVAY